MKTRQFFSYVFGLAVFAMLAAFSLVSLTSANVKKARPNGYEFTTTVLVESQADSFAIDQNITNETGYFWQATATQDSFATDALWILYESAWDTEDRWVPKDTVTIGAAGNYSMTGTTRAKRVMTIIQTDTTNQQGTYNVAATLVETF